jgi:hypothetical protein
VAVTSRCNFVAGTVHEPKSIEETVLHAVRRLERFRVSPTYLVGKRVKASAIESIF